MGTESAARSVRGHAAALVILLPLLASSSNATTLDFDDLLHGEIVSMQFEGVEIFAVNPNRSFDLAVAFDSRVSGSADPDLEADPSGPPYWSGGNLAAEELGVFLIVQESDASCDASFCSDPDDEGMRPGGDLVFVFDDPIRRFGFDLVDVEHPAAEEGSVEFFHAGGSLSIDFGDLLALGDFGDHTANRIAAIDAADLGLEMGTEFHRVTIHLGGSGGVDNVFFDDLVTTPEPGAAALLALGLLGLAVAPGLRGQGRS